MPVSTVISGGTSGAGIDQGVEGAGQLAAEVPHRPDLGDGIRTGGGAGGLQVEHHERHRVERCPEVLERPLCPEHRPSVASNTCSIKHLLLPGPTLVGSADQTDAGRPSSHRWGPYPIVGRDRAWGARAVRRYPRRRCGSPGTCISISMTSSAGDCSCCSTGPRKRAPPSTWSGWVSTRRGTAGRRRCEGVGGRWRCMPPCTIAVRQRTLRSALFTLRHRQGDDFDDDAALIAAAQVAGLDPAVMLAADRRHRSGASSAARPPTWPVGTGSRRCPTMVPGRAAADHLHHPGGRARARPWLASR